MQTKDYELAKRYLPHFYVDLKEPFPIEYIGYRVFRESAESSCFPRDVLLRDNAVMAIEYAIYFDYDIQHLYELEHAWIYVDPNGRVVDGEGSAHGSVFNCMRLGRGLEEESHLPLYLQPGKHAILPREELFPLFPAYLRSCGEEAGNMGLLVADLFQGHIDKPEGADAAVERFIKERYAFVPAFSFERAAFDMKRLIPTQALLDLIPERITGILSDIMENMS